ncbi:hypothetical protein ACFWOT_09075 [Streptomyces sp. NPDC058440]|uniref:hypothetical protein n=1 Tax=Streptomyces sp. NPDC058440 TaxID=3346501 RepID=UPI00366024C8
MTNTLETYEVHAGDVIHTGRVFFKVAEVREPTHPAFPGLVFEGHYFDNRRQVWQNKTTLSAQHGHKWGPVTGLEFPDLYFTAYLKSGDLAIVENFDNGKWCWSHEVKCKVLVFGEKTSWVKITGNATQFVTGKVYEVPSQRLYRRKVK